MLVHFPCERCGTELTARPDYAGRTLPCHVCRYPMVVPVVTVAAPVQPRLKRVEVDDEVAAEIAARADSEARRLAMIEARYETRRGRAVGLILICAGVLAVAFGVTGLSVAGLWIPRGSAIATLALGAVVLVLGTTVWRLVGEATQDEYRRRVPGIAERLRRQYWETHCSISRPTLPSVRVP